MDYCHVSRVGNYFQKHAQNWQTVPAIKEARIDPTATPLPDGRVLVPGGVTSQERGRALEP